MKYARIVTAAAVLAGIVMLLIWWRRPVKRAPAAQSPVNASLVPAHSSNPDSASINVYAHNLKLHRGPDFRVYIQWLRGQITPAQRNVNPSFDDPESFFLDIKAGILRANIGDINAYLKASGAAGSSLRDVSLSGDGDQIKLKATFHKVVPLPVEIDGTIAPGTNNGIQVHVTKLSVLKVPMKGLLKDFHVGLPELIHPDPGSGIQVSEDTLLLDTHKLLPPPHIRGQLTAVRTANPDLVEVYGPAEKEVERVEQWRNFLRLRDGTLDFGKLTMHHVDLIMIDISSDAWFDLDLAHYQEQLVNGYTRMTPQAGLQIFMPDLDTIPHSKVNQNISIEWLKNRNVPPPPYVVSK